LSKTHRSSKPETPSAINPPTGKERSKLRINGAVTNPATSVCLASPAPTVMTQIDANATPTFGIFVTGAGAIPLMPAPIA
jgi:hypothetical protein